MFDLFHAFLGEKGIKPFFVCFCLPFLYFYWALIVSIRMCISAVPNNTDQMPTPNDMEERIRREVEKKEIRRQIFSGELARRKMLEEEVRRELMMEREMDLRRNLREKLSFEERVAMGLNPGHDMNISPPSYGNRLLEEPVASPHSREFDDILTVPQLPQFVAAEIKPALQTNKDKVIMLVMLISSSRCCLLFVFFYLFMVVFAMEDYNL